MFPTIVRLMPVADTKSAATVQHYVRREHGSATDSRHASVRAPNQAQMAAGLADTDE